MLSRTAGDIVSRPSVSAAPLYSFHCSVCAWIFSLSSAFFRKTPPVATPEHREHRVGIGDDLSRSRRDQVFAQARAVAAQQRDHPLAARLRGAQQAMDFVRGGQAGAEARDLDDDRANVVVNRGRLERVAEMVEAMRAAAHAADRAASESLLFDRTRQANYHDGATAGFARV